MVELLSGTGDYTLTLADQDAAALARIPADQAGTVELEVTNGPRLRDALRGHDMVMSAAPYPLTPVVAEDARDVGAARSAERPVGNECGRTCLTRWSKAP